MVPVWKDPCANTRAQAPAALQPAHRPRATRPFVDSIPQFRTPPLRIPHSERLDYLGLTLIHHLPRSASRLRLAAAQTRTTSQNSQPRPAPAFPLEIWSLEFLWALGIASLDIPTAGRPPTWGCTAVTGVTMLPRKQMRKSEALHCRYNAVTNPPQALQLPS